MNENAEPPSAAVRGPKVRRAGRTAGRYRPQPSSRSRSGATSPTQGRAAGPPRQIPGTYRCFSSLPSSRQRIECCVPDVRGALGQELEVVRVGRRPPLDHLPEQVVELLPQRLVREHLRPTGELELGRALLAGHGRVHVHARVAQQVARFQRARDHVGEQVAVEDVRLDRRDARRPVLRQRPDEDELEALDQLAAVNGDLRRRLLELLPREHGGSLADGRAPPPLLASGPGGAPEQASRRGDGASRPAVAGLFSWSGRERGWSRSRRWWCGSGSRR
jgi:hypothetical protein